MRIKRESLQMLVKVVSRNDDPEMHLHQEAGLMIQWENAKTV